MMDHLNPNKTTEPAGISLGEDAGYFRTVFDSAAIGMALVGLEGKWLRVNPSLCDFLGRSEQDLLGLNYQQVTHPEDLAIDLEVVQRLLEGATRSYTLEKRYIRNDGRVVWAQLSVALMRGADGAPRQFIAQIQDISERKQAETSLKASEGRFRLIVENLRDVFYITDPGLTEVFYVSPAFEVIWGFPAAALAISPRAWFEAIHPEDRPHVQRAVLESQTGIHDIEYRIIRPDGSIRWIHDRCFGLLLGEGRLPQHVGIAEDITERSQAQESLRKSERWFRSLIENAGEPVGVLDSNARVIYASPAYESVYGYSPGELLGTMPFERIHPDDRANVTATLSQLMQSPGSKSMVRLRYQHKERGWRVLDVTAWNLLQDPAVQGIVVNSRDVTEKERLEEQLRQAQKMEAVGRLAGGITHDFNNLLTAILANTELVLAELPDGPVRLDVEVIRRTAERAAALTRQLLAFSRKQVIHPQLVDPNAVLTGMAQLLRRTLGDGITLESELGDIGAVLADPGQLEQVLLNLALNARDAMPGGGTLTLRTRDLLVDEAFARNHRGLRSGSYVAIAVEDTGSGISPEIQTRVFEPFFTTKPLGEGTGLGLSSVYGLVKQWDGYIALRSTVGEGTTFTIYLRRQEAPALARAAAVQRYPRGSETVLVVEDEAAVRSSILRMLSRHGYTVIEARHGGDAIRIFDSSARAISLVITDLMMPEMGGRELIAQLGARPTPPRILVMSGYDEQASMRGEGLPADINFMEKPFSMDGLLQRVRETLDSPKTH